MKVLQVPFCFYPDPVGGTETYVLGLSRWLRKLAFAVEIAAPGTRDETYSHEGFPVHRYRVNDPAPSLLDLYGEGDAAAAGRFEALLGRVRPELLHMHAFTSGVSLRLVRVAKRYGIPVIFTYHTPAVSCQRGTLLRWGQDVCDGSLNVQVCSQCVLEGMGLPRPISRIAGSLPPSIGSFIGHMGLSGGPFTVIRMADLTGARHRAFQALTAMAGPDPAMPSRTVRRYRRPLSYSP